MNYWDNLMGSDEQAGNYMMTYGEGPGAETRTILQSFINNGESVLDVGCGPGWNMDHFAQFGPAVSEYKGVDYSIRFVRAANKRIKEQNAQQFTPMKIHRFERQDARALKEPFSSWDVVLIQDCLEHTDGYEIPINECLGIARKRVIVSFWHLTENDDHINDDGDDGWGAWYSRPKWEEFLDTLPYMWTHERLTQGNDKHRDFYIIDKEEPK